MWKAWSPMEQCSEMGFQEDNWISKTLISSMESSTDGLIFNELGGGGPRKWGPVGGDCFFKVWPQRLDYVSTPNPFLPISFSAFLAANMLHDLCSPCFCHPMGLKTSTSSKAPTLYQILEQSHPWILQHLQKQGQQHHHQLSESEKEGGRKFCFI